MQDSNDITFNYQIDIVSVFSWLLERILGIDYVELSEVLLVFWYWFSIVSFLICVFLLVGIAYAMLRFKQIAAIDSESLKEAERAWRQTSGAQGGDARWQEVERHAASENPNDWRLAIIEADILLDGLLDEQGYSGGSIGEKLRSARLESFASLQDAWDAHKIRNDIAHRGSDFVLTKRIAQEAITKYRRVFEEFGAL